jgi:hypothetical protein
MSENESKHFFLKKEAKTFAISGARCRNSRLISQKFFGSFFQKRTAFSLT